MIFDYTRKKLCAKWTRRLALTMSLLYLINPLHRPLNFAIHQLLEIFESTDEIIGHETNFLKNEAFIENSHDHKTMHLGSGHNIIDLITQVFELSNEDESTDETSQKSVKIDKHITYSEFNLQPTEKKLLSSIFWLPEQKLNKGHPIKSEEPPRLV